MPKKITPTSPKPKPASAAQAKAVSGRDKLSKPARHSTEPARAAKVSAAAAAVTRRLKDFCRGLPGTTEDIKWVDHLCFSVGGKMFAIFDVVDNGHVAFKADEIEFERLTRKRGIIPAPYAARFSWVKIVEHDAMAEKQVQACLRRSRELIIEKLPAKKRAAVKVMEVGRE